MRRSARPTPSCRRARGADVHKCAGYDFATVMMQLFAVLALRTAKWELPAQDLSLKWVSAGIQERPHRPLVQERLKRQGFAA